MIFEFMIAEQDCAEFIFCLAFPETLSTGWIRALKVTFEKGCIP